MAPAQDHLSWNNKKGFKAINISNIFYDSMYNKLNTHELAFIKQVDKAWITTVIEDLESWRFER